MDPVLGILTNGLKYQLHSKNLKMFSSKCISIVYNCIYEMANVETICVYILVNAMIIYAKNNIKNTISNECNAVRGT